jgi:hypothetical protein
LGPIDLSEILSRFILQRNWYRSSDNTVKYAAFMPNPKSGETSVFRTTGISDEEIWLIGEIEVATRRGKPISGRADIETAVVISLSLRVVPSEPPERHANITGWPDGRSAQKLIAIKLAEKAQFIKKSD